MFRLVVFVCLLVFVRSARILQKPIPDGRIVGGYEIDISKAPYQISLQRFGSHICGGSLISANHVLTAAHCTSGSSASSLTVRLGSSKHASGGVLVRVKKINQHAQYNPSTIDYDFCVLELFNYNSNGLVSSYVTLPKQGQDVQDGTLLTVTGWGETKSSWESNDDLRAVSVPKFNQETCKKFYSRQGLVTNRMICAGLENGGKDSCQGDSGGPLVFNNIQLGIVSWGYGCAMQNYPGVYSRVASVSDWIMSFILV